ncbi:hypothetical protein [Microcoleus sp.]|uniref:hypothetical protein n=1 Tax=Microcoleus sp. TaxID=44472 RepID=UPI00359325D9
MPAVTPPPVIRSRATTTLSVPTSTALLAGHEMPNGMASSAVSLKQSSSSVGSRTEMIARL